MAMSGRTRAFVSGAAAWLAGLFGVSGGAMALLAWQRASLPYNENGNHFADGVNLNEAGALAWWVLAFATLLMALLLVLVHRRFRRPR
mgnify:FL=1